ncbi:MAG: ribose ABC transporter permease [Dongiaceae bacterium]
MFVETRMLLRSWLKNPLHIGAVAPSSRDLAEAMARLVPVGADGPVIELGGGTGVVTDALLAAGVPPDRLVVVERDAALHAYLAREYPDVAVVRGDAAKLAELLRPLGIDAARAVVSSLPILSMSRATRHAIVEQSFALLAPGAPFIQFTYGLFSPLARREFGLEGALRKRVLGNLPPASVWLYRRPDPARAA